MNLENTIICIRHPKYSGVVFPDPACRTCCGKYIAGIRAAGGKTELSGPHYIKPKKSKPHTFSPNSAQRRF